MLSSDLKYSAWKISVVKDVVRRVREDLEGDSAVFTYRNKDMMAVKAASALELKSVPLPYLTSMIVCTLESAAKEELIITHFCCRTDDGRTYYPKRYEKFIRTIEKKLNEEGQLSHFMIFYFTRKNHEKALRCYNTMVHKEMSAESILDLILWGINQREEELTNVVS